MNELQVPVELLNLILGLVSAGATWLVVAGIKGLGEVFKKELSKPAKTIAAIVSAGAVGVVSGLLDLAALSVPTNTVEITQYVLGLLVLLLTPMGIQRQSKK